MQLKFEKLKVLPKKEYLIVYLLEQLPKGLDFGRWPLHITIVPWFEIEDPAKAAEILKQVCQTHKPFWATVGPTALFGSKNNLPVHTISNPNSLVSLHKELTYLLEAANAKFPNDKNLGKNYIPHITKKSFGKVQQGYRIDIDKIHLVEAPIANRLTRLKKVISVGYLK
jgi:2'-5' RNA ligase